MKKILCKVMAFTFLSAIVFLFFYWAIANHF